MLLEGNPDKVGKLCSRQQKPGICQARHSIIIVNLAKPVAHYTDTLL